MAHGNYKVVDVNPNDNCGGGGCVCDPRKQLDCRGPYVVFPDSEMYDYRSPHCVICSVCLDMAYKALHEGEVLAGGERVEPLPADYQAIGSELPLLAGQRTESPVVESPDPKHDFEDEPAL